MEMVRLYALSLLKVKTSKPQPVTTASTWRAPPKKC